MQGNGPIYIGLVFILLLVMVALIVSLCSCSQLQDVTNNTSEITALDDDVAALDSATTNMSYTSSTNTTTFASNLQALTLSVPTISGVTEINGTEVSTLQNQASSITTLNTEYNTLNSDIKTLNTQVATLNTEYNTLNSEVTTLNNEVTTLTTTVDNLATYASSPDSDTGTTGQEFVTNITAINNDWTGLNTYNVQLPTTTLTPSSSNQFTPVSYVNTLINTATSTLLPIPSSPATFTLDFVDVGDVTFKYYIIGSLVILQWGGSATVNFSYVTFSSNAAMPTSVPYPQSECESIVQVDNDNSGVPGFVQIKTSGYINFDGGPNGQPFNGSSAIGNGFVTYIS